MRRIVCVLALGLLFSSVACKSGSSPPPGSPSSSGVSVAGTWNGDLAALGTVGRTTWVLTQTNTAVAGTALVLLPTGTVLLNGTVAGTVTGSTLTYAISVGPGGLPSQPACVAQLGGTMSIAGTP